MTDRTQNTEPARRGMTRRRFIASTAAAASLTIVKPARVRGTEANSRVTVGCVGLGGRGGWIARALAKKPGYQITAVADYFARTAQSVGGQLKVPANRRFSGLDGYKGLLAAKVDAVFLETPPWFFPAHASAAVAAGCHVYVAKPVAVDVPGGLTIAEIGKRSTRNKKVFLVDFQTRTDPFHIQAIRHVREGTLGKIGLMSSFYTDECFADPPKRKTIENRLRGLIWVNDTDLGGSYIVNCDIHAVDVALWIAGSPPESAVGFSCVNRPNPHGDTHDCYAVSYRFKGGAVLSNRSEHVRNNFGFSSGCHAYGQKAYIETQYDGRVWIRGISAAYRGGECKGLYGRGMLSNVDTFHKSITQGIHDNPTVQPSVDSTLATILGREAALKGRKITWTELLKDTTRLEVDLTGLKA